MSRGTRSLTFYLLMILGFGGLMYLIAKLGEGHQIDAAISSVYDTPSNLSEGFDVFLQLLLHQIREPIGILLLQIIVILLCCRVFGWLFMKMGQPTVIGEIVAGIVLGPSILGHWFPETAIFLFPAESLANIHILSQFGLILFMFAIGMELDIDEVKKKMNETILISHTSIIVPFFLGMLVAFYMYTDYADPSTPFISFALFIGIAMSITAFPVLARIIQEKGLTRSHLGTVTLASAANGDITAWCLLAVVVAIAQAGSMLSAIYNIMFSVLYLVIMFLVLRPFMRMIGQIYNNKEVIDKGLVALMFLVLIVSSYCTEILGLHALFGAFMAGVVMPSNIKFRKILSEKVEDVSLSLFLPLFFVSTGLRTEIGLLNTSELWVMCGVVILVAIIGKFGGAMVAARFTGENWKNSLYIGALMNTRGLMELVVLTIGYEMGILTPPIFVMLVIMTLVTTFMTGPILSIIKYSFRAHDRKVQQQLRANQKGVYKVLLSFGRASNGQVMLDVAHQLFSRGKNRLELTALHLTVGPDVNPLHMDNFEDVSFGPILYGAKKLGIQIETRYEIANNPGQEICRIVNEEGYNFLLVGAGISMSNLPDDIEANKYRDKYMRRFHTSEIFFSAGGLLKDKTRMFVEQSDSSVGVFINRNFVKANRVLLVIDGEEDLILLNYVKWLLRSTHGDVRILNRTNSRLPENEVVLKRFDDFVAKRKQTIILKEKEIMPEVFASGVNFMMISYRTWNEVSERQNEALQQMPSTIIINHKSQNGAI
ncbi:cation:proton antiporter [Parabacteroides sp. OttesenSCG-928-G07]|nr:cation:proton antiporter [Parabacteroides sp. OttesenSCG-928-G07]